MFWPRLLRHNCCYSLLTAHGYNVPAEASSTTFSFIKLGVEVQDSCSWLWFCNSDSDLCRPDSAGFYDVWCFCTCIDCWNFTLLHQPHGNECVLEAFALLEPRGSYICLIHQYHCRWFPDRGLVDDCGFLRTSWRLRLAIKRVHLSLKELLTMCGPMCLEEIQAVQGRGAARWRGEGKFKIITNLCKFCFQISQSFPFKEGSMQCAS